MTHKIFQSNVLSLICLFIKILVTRISCRIHHHSSVMLYEDVFLRFVVNHPPPQKKTLLRSPLLSAEGQTFLQVISFNVWYMCSAVNLYDCTTSHTRIQTYIFYSSILHIRNIDLTEFSIKTAALTEHHPSGECISFFPNTQYSGQ